MPGDGRNLGPKRTIGGVPQRVYIIRREVFEDTPQLMLVPAVSEDDSPNTSVQVSEGRDSDLDLQIARATGAVIVAAAGGPTLQLVPDWSSAASDDE
jgi:hypothetical protein